MDTHESTDETVGRDYEVSPDSDNQADAGEEIRVELPSDEKKQRKCCPRMKKKEDRIFAIICGVGAVVFGTLIIGVPSYVVLKAAFDSGIDPKTKKWKGFPETLNDKQPFYQHTKAVALQFGYFLASLSGFFVILGIVIIGYNACGVKNLPEVEDTKQSLEGSASKIRSGSAFKHMHHGSCEMEVKQRESAKRESAKRVP